MEFGAKDRPRFVPVEQRQDRDPLTPALWRGLTERYAELHWRGIPIDKGPFQLAAYPMLLFQERIESVIELGSGSGGSAVWMADHLRLYGRSGPVISVDLDLSQLAPAATSHPGIRFMAGDSAHIAQALPADLLSTLPHPWLILEDTHVNVFGILEHLHEHGLRAGDYVIIEDTNGFLAEAWADWPDKSYLQRWALKLPEMRRWLARHPGQYVVDTLYLDLFGHNTSKCWNSILKHT